MGELTRRQAIAITACGLAYRCWGEQSAAGMKDTRTALHEEIELKGTPERIYHTLLDSGQFAAFSGLPAEIDPKAGGAFRLFGGQITGRTIELEPNHRIVQAWRPSHWDPGIYSIAGFVLNVHGAGTMAVLDHKGFPEGDFDGLTSGWHEHYWDRLTKYLAQAPIPASSLPGPSARPHPVRG